MSEIEIVGGNQPLANATHAPVHVPVAANPMAMLAHAVQSGASVEALEKLMGLQERWQANEARRAFDNAMAALRQDLPPILKTREVNFGGDGAKYKHEPLDAVTGALSPAMAKHGLSFRWRIDDTNAARIRVTCVIAHRDGHFEETSMSAAPDNSGKKNAIQQAGSAVTYLQRYTLKAAVGVAASHDDDNAGGPSEAEAEEIAQHVELWSKAINGATTPAALNIVAKNMKEEGDAIPQAALLELRKLFAARAKALKDAKPQEASDAGRKRL